MVATVVDDLLRNVPNRLVLIRLRPVATVVASFAGDYRRCGRRGNNRNGWLLVAGAGLVNRTRVSKKTPGSLGRHKFFRGKAAVSSGLVQVNSALMFFPPSLVMGLNPHLSLLTYLYSISSSIWDSNGKPYGSPHGSRTCRYNCCS